MRKKKLCIALCIAAALAVGTGAVAYARSTYGTEDDPLITLSYLQERFKPQIMDEVEELLGSGTAGSSPQGSFAVVTLSRGQTLTGQAGCQVMLRIGSSQAAGSDYPALIDTSTGGELADGGAMVKNHLYMVTISGNGLMASSDGTKVLVSGEYSID